MAVPFDSSSNTPAQVLVGLSLDPPKQNRLTVLFRYILALPLLIVTWLVSIVTMVVVVIAWFAALIMGRVPDGMQEFIVGYQRLSLNVTSYLYLLVPKWPGMPFDEDANTQVTLHVDQVKLNRAAVFFRGILAVPAYLLMGLLAPGLAVYVFAMWVTGIVMGRTPAALHQAVALIVRYSARYGNYVWLTSPTQPWGGLLGDLQSGGPVEKPTSWKVAPAARTLVIVAMCLGVLWLVWIIAMIASGSSTPPPTY